MHGAIIRAPPSPRLTGFAALTGAARERHCGLVRTAGSVPSGCRRPPPSGPSRSRSASTARYPPGSMRSPSLVPDSGLRMCLQVEPPGGLRTPQPFIAIVTRSGPSLQVAERRDAVPRRRPVVVSHGAPQPPGFRAPQADRPRRSSAAVQVRVPERHHEPARRQPGHTSPPGSPTPRAWRGTSAAAQSRRSPHGSEFGSNRGRRSGRPRAGRTNSNPAVVTSSLRPAPSDAAQARCIGGRWKASSDLVGRAAEDRPAERLTTDAADPAQRTPGDPLLGGHQSLRHRRHGHGAPHPTAQLLVARRTPSASVLRLRVARGRRRLGPVARGHLVGEREFLRSYAAPGRPLPVRQRSGGVKAGRTSRTAPTRAPRSRRTWLLGRSGEEVVLDLRSRLPT